VLKSSRWRFFLSGPREKATDGHCACAPCALCKLLGDKGAPELPAHRPHPQISVPSTVPAKRMVFDDTIAARARHPPRCDVQNCCAVQLPNGRKAKFLQEERVARACRCTWPHVHGHDKVR